jgi:hypothetical protein
MGWTLERLLSSSVGRISSLMPLYVSNLSIAPLLMRIADKEISRRP